MKAVNKKNFIKIRKLLGIGFLVVFAVSSILALNEILMTKKEDAAFKELASVIKEEKVEDKISYLKLYEENPDLFGWIRIDDTPVDYPVMHTPDDPEYYLRRAFDKSDSLSGTPFLDGQCFKDCGNYLIYGHNVKNGTMFAEILNYADSAYYAKHPIIHFDLVDEKGEYQILAAFDAQILDINNHKGFRYYTYTVLQDESRFYEYLNAVYEVALYDTGVQAEFGDQLLTLSTCKSYNTTNDRFVVVAKRIS